MELSPAERIEKLLAGMPGQQFRLLRAVELCAEPRTLEEAAAALDEAHPSPTSVYSSVQVIQLLERAGALERLEDEGAGDAPAEGEEDRATEAMGESADADIAPSAAEDGEALAEGEEPEGDFISVTPAPPCRYQATQAGFDAIAAHVNEDRIVQKIVEEKRYLPISSACWRWRRARAAAPPRSSTPPWTATRCAPSRGASAVSSAASSRRRVPSSARHVDHH